MTELFLTALALTLALRLGLKLRHIRHILAHRDQVPADFADRISLASHQKAADYAVDRSQLAIFATLLDAALLLALTLGGGLQALHSAWSAQADGLVYGVGLMLSVLLISSLVDLPLAIYKQFVIEARHGFNRMTARLFIADLAKQALLGLLIGVPVLTAILWLMDMAGETWWLAVWLFWSSLNLALMFIYPTWIAPLFNKFTPLDDPQLKARIESLLARCGFRSSGLFVMDGSRRSSHGNAYFTGFGDNKRIVFFDTLLARLSPAEIEAVLAHELGHFRKKHIVQRLITMFAVSLGLLALLGQLLPWAPFYTGLGVDAQSTALGLTLFFLVIPVFTYPLTPLSSLWSRRHEFEADAYAAEHAQAEDLVRALVKLYDDNAATLTPDPWHSVFYDSHPPAAQRIAQLRTTTQEALA